MSADESLQSIFRRPPQVTTELAEAIRQLTETFLRVPAVPTDVTAEIRQACQMLTGLRARLEPLALHDAMPAMGADDRGRRPYFVRGVTMGDHHPMRPDLQIGFADGITSGNVRFGVTFEGPPGCVHGGLVAHFFDQILGQHNLNVRLMAMTGSLSVRYLQGTPIMRDLRFEVRHEIEGARKIRTRGHLHADGVTFSEAEGIFIVPRAAAWDG